MKMLPYILMIAFVSFGQIKITGTQEGVYDSSQYIVSQEIIVPEGKKLEFMPGSVILLGPYSGIKILGEFKLVECEVAANDSSGKIWNGITVDEKGALYFDKVTIKNSLFGIKVPDSTSLKKFKDVTFIDNMKTLQINNSAVFVENGKPLTLVVENSDKESSPDKPVKIITEAPAENNRFGNIIKSSRWISATAALACSGLCTYCAIRSEQYYGKYENSDSNNDAQKYYDKSNKYLNYSVISGIGAGVFGVSLLFTLSL